MEIEQTQMKIVCSTRFFEIEDHAEQPDYPLEISNNKSILSQQYFNEEFIKLFGLISINQSFQTGCFGHKQLILQNMSEGGSMANEIMLFTNMMINNINGFFSTLWFIKDCASHLGELFIHVPDIGGGVYINNTSHYSKSDGLNEPTLFSKEEILKAIEINKMYSAIIGKNAENRISDFPEEITNIIPSKLSQRRYNQTNRLERAMMFLDLARSSSFMPIKLSMYVPLLESIFSLTNETEISHKISERCAVYVGGSKDEKIETYKTIKSAYGVRSNLLHGATIKNDDAGYLSILCSNTDCIVRIVLNKVIAGDWRIFHDSKIDLEVYFRDALLS